MNLLGTEGQPGTMRLFMCLAGSLCAADIVSSEPQWSEGCPLACTPWCRRGGLTYGGIRGVAGGLRGGALLLFLLLAVRCERALADCGAGGQLRRGRQQLRAARRFDGVLGAGEGREYDTRGGTKTFYLFCLTKSGQVGAI